MLKEVIVLCPNGRRQIVKCLPNTSFVQVLAEVCQKQGYSAEKFELRHHNKSVDMTNLAKYSTLPNKAVLEMFEVEANRGEGDVRIGLQTKSGERKMGTFKPSSNLLSIISTLTPELLDDPNIGILYMGTAVYANGLEATTLRQMGLTSGNAVLRIISYTPEELKEQPNVSAVTTYPVKTATTTMIEEEALIKKSKLGEPSNKIHEDTSKPTTSGAQNNIFNEIKKQIKSSKNMDCVNEMEVDENSESDARSQSGTVEGKERNSNVADTMENHELNSISSKINLQLEIEIRRGLTEGSLSFLGEHFPVTYYLHSTVRCDEPDEFFELSVDEVSKLYSQLQAQAKALQEVPFQLQKPSSSIPEKRSVCHQYAVIRIQLPDETAIQGIFHPNDTLRHIYDFTKRYVTESARDFQLVTYPRTSLLDMATTLSDAKYVPCVRLLYLPSSKTETEESFLLEEYLKKMVSNETADLIASKFRLSTNSS